jgi:putative ABC transport system ATP-binding protein
VVIVKARGLKKIYSSDGATVRALEDVDVDIERGEFIAIMGPSGSGKSTLLHMVGALDVPDEGEVLLSGQALSGMSRGELALMRRRHIGFVFQFFNLVPILSVAENISFPAVLDGVKESVYGPRMTELVARLGLTEQLTKLPAQLSGGQQQRVAIARALINAPDLVLADEPTGNLDRRSGADVMSMLRTLNEDGQTIVVVTHDAAVASFARRVLFMRDGQLVDETRLKAPGQTSAVLSRLVKLDED